MLRLGLIAPIAGPVTRDSTSSIEQLVWLLAEELVRLGYDVTLFATGDSVTSAHLCSLYPHGYTVDPELLNWHFHESMHIAAVIERGREFDVLHSHNYYLALPFSRLLATPMLHTHHVLPNPDIIRAYAAHPEAHVAALSRFQRAVFGASASMPVVYHGLETDAFPFSNTPGEYLVYLGRMIFDKGPVEAIHAARKAGMRLVLAGPDSEYFRTLVAPLVDNVWVEYVGPVDHRERNELLAGAAALLYPLQKPEPFGLVLIEAMLCGTPVVALDLGAVSEIVEDGVTGYVASSVESLPSLIPKAMQVDRARVRARAVDRFDYRRMAGEYARVYEQLAPGALGLTG